MKMTPLLSDKPETASLMLKGVASGELQVRQSQERAGCNCDRWGHPCSGCVEHKIRPEPGSAISSKIKRAR
jgi:hypothetical protein